MSTSLHQEYDIAIFQLAVYALLSPVALVVLVKTLLARKLWLAVGWVYLLGFLSLLLAASGLIIGVGKDGVSATGLVLSSVGLAPLFMVVERVLAEAISNSAKPYPVLFGLLGHAILHILVIAAAVITGIGASDIFSASSTPEDIRNGRTLVKAGVVVFIIPWLWLVAMAVVALRQWSTANRKLALAGVIALALLLIRIIYGMLEFYLNDSSAFSPLNGNVVARLFMNVLPLMFSSALLTIAGAMEEFKQ